jgi:hypothetical protein
MSVCLLTSDARHSAPGERIAALAEAMRAPVVVSTGRDVWPEGVHVDELDRKFDTAIAFGWRACLHVFRVEAKSYAYRVPALEEAQLWHGDERRLLAALTYDLPLVLIAPNAAVAKALEERGPGRSIVIVAPGIERDESGAGPGSDAGGGADADGAALRVASTGPADEILARASEPIERADLDAADVLVEIAAADAPLDLAPQAMLRGVVPVVTPVDDDLVEDGETGIVVGFDDVPGAARALDTLARDRDLLRRLSDNARERAERLPTIEAEAKALVKAAGKIDSGWPARLLLNARAVAEPIAEERRALDNALRSYDERIAALGAENEALRAQVDEQARAYRVGKRLEPLWGPVARARKK